MSQEETVKRALSSDIDDLNAQIKALTQKLKVAYQEKADLEILLETATAHSDVLLEEIQQEKTDLEILLETTTEHSDVIEYELQTQAEAARRETEEQFRLIAEATPVSIMIIRLDGGQILYANETAGLFFGVDSQTLLEHCAPEFYYEPSDREAVVAALNERGYFQGELRLKRFDNTYFWALSSFRKFSFKGETTVLSALSDITDRKHAEEALRLAEENYRSIFENALEGIFQTTPDGQIISINPAMARILGYESPQEIMATSSNVSSGYVDPVDRAEFIRLMELQGSVKGFEHQMYRRDGTIIWIAESARAVRDANGVVLYYEGIVEDITLRKQEEEALRQQVKQLQIEIDENKRAKQVAEITETDYFQQLLQEADDLRYTDDW